MKKVLILFFLFSINCINAQYGYGGYGNGMDRRTTGMSQSNQAIPDDKPEEIPVEKTVATIMERMKIAVKLDELQVIAISNILKESIREHGILLKQKYSEEEQIKNFEALSEVTDRKIIAFLNKDQKENYLIFKETKNNKTPKSKKNKNK